MRLEPVLARLRNPVRAYAWGSHEVLADLQGRASPTSTPEAELWLGAHPSGPSTLLLDEGERRLDEAIADDPIGMLGGRVVEQFGAELPFLLKVLAVARPLSLQAHPGAARAAEGYAREQAQGIPLGAPERSYGDPWPKPELLRALTPFEALCGLRDTEATGQLLDLLDVAELRWLRDAVGVDGPAAAGEAISRLLRLPADECAAIIARLLAAARPVAESDGPWTREAAWLIRLGEDYPDDPGVLVALLLELVHLDPGEAIPIPVGVLHCYLRGAGVEIMASSDNVLRGGLTDKHVDVAELVHVLDVDDGRTAPVVPVEMAGELAYPLDTPWFRLSELGPGGSHLLEPRGASILLAADGGATVEADGRRLELAGGQGAFVAARAEEVTVAPTGTVFRATVGDPD